MTQKPECEEFKPTRLVCQKCGVASIPMPKEATAETKYTCGGCVSGGPAAKASRVPRRLRFDYDPATRPETFGMTRKVSCPIESADVPESRPEPGDTSITDEVATKIYEEFRKICEQDSRDRDAQKLAGLKAIVSMPEVRAVIGEEGYAVLSGLLEGQSHQELAARLSVSESEIRVIRDRAIEKVGRRRRQVRPLAAGKLGEFEETQALLDDLTEREGTDHDIDPQQEVWEHDPEDGYGHDD